MKNETTKETEKSHTDQIWGILVKACKEMEDKNISPNEFPPIAAQWLIVSALSMTDDPDLAEHLAKRVISIQQEVLDRFIAGDEGFDGLPCKQKGTLQ
jgi:hypothetical protein